MTTTTQYRYFDYHDQPARAPVGHPFAWATQILWPDGTWQDQPRSDVTEIPRETAIKLARSFVKPGTALPKDLA